MKQIQNDLTGEAQTRYLARYLNRLPLFKRLKADKLERDYIPKMTFEQKNKKEVLVLPNDKTVYIVLNGKVVLREHKMGNPCDFSLV